MITKNELVEIEDRVFTMLSKYGKSNTVLTSKETNEILTRNVVNIVLEVSNGTNQKTSS